MLKFLSRITGSNRSDIKDARRLYQKLMVQSRSPQFYGQQLCADSTDGRMEILCLHLSTAMYALRQHGDNGAKLSQAIYDVMIDDFDIALREEGLSDTGVARRIKPMAAMFFERAKLYADAFASKENKEQSLNAIISKFITKNETSKELNGETAIFARYTEGLLSQISDITLGQIASAEIEFPKFL